MKAMFGGLRSARGYLETLGAEQTGSAPLSMLLTVSTALTCPTDLRLVMHDVSGSYESSKVLLAKAGFDGTLELLSSAWERVLGYGREELKDKTLFHFMWCNPRRTAAAAAAIMDELNMGCIDLRLRCRDGRGKCFTLHRLYDKDEHMMYIVAEETPEVAPLGMMRAREERRAHARVKKPSPFDRPLEQSTGRKFAQMTQKQRWIFVAKLLVCVATFGLAFPNVQQD